MNKNDLVAAVANEADMSKADAAKAIDGVFVAITESLQRQEEVRLVGFGTFSVAKRAASQGRNPRTGERINIPASNQPKFKAGKGLKAAVN
ncbi:MAG: HU family DNA-binding protein [Rhodospirillales bacterium]|nr:HU family DNA-binding protein [Rhodospirillales bacterium]HIJ43831.1 HU family DNA-binding protein [Rhodospirillaceae bacterium]MDP7097570.1 HU family DNA-binding protein [Rhodospirillales bacterium]MDP7214719.1 HU family DNA-binding protein [Rhodospirillales bacterium]HIJ45518.1 HU family DNA-binding protein [Rhodospirillaceae bacterium]